MTGVYTNIENVDQDVKDGFYGTFTCLGVLKQDTADIITTLSSITDLNSLIQVLDELISTVSMIEDVTQSLSGIDFSGTFTAIAAVQSSLDMGFDGTFTTLEVITDKVCDIQMNQAGTFTCLGVIKEFN